MRLQEFMDVRSNGVKPINPGGISINVLGSLKDGKIPGRLKVKLYRLKLDIP